MIITINDREIELFDGALVKNVLLKYSPDEHKAVLSGEKKIVDKNGNPVDLDGELSAGAVLNIKNKLQS